MDDTLEGYRTQFMWDVLRQAGTMHFESVVDLGCGDGANLRALARRVGATRAAGIDLGVQDQNFGSVVLQRGNLLDYAPSRPYQLVVSNQVFEHIYAPWLPRYFAALKASCAPNGMILLSTPNRWRPKNIMRLFAFRRPFMMSQNPGVPPEQHLGHHRECSYRQLRALMNQQFPAPEWKVVIVRTVPRVIESNLRWLVNILVYGLLWILWRPLFVSASQDHYVIIRRLGLVERQDRMVRAR
jgi:SAM-dependent methyltransferase